MPSRRSLFCHAPALQNIVDGYRFPLNEWQKRLRIKNWKSCSGWHGYRTQSRQATRKEREGQPKLRQSGLRYARFHERDDGRRQFFAVLHGGRIDSFAATIRAAIMAEAKAK